MKTEQEVRKNIEDWINRYHGTEISEELKIWMLGYRMALEWVLDEN